MSDSNDNLIVVIGRGHSGTRMLSQMLYASGVYMGELLNHCGDTMPPQAMYHACHVIGGYVEQGDDRTWNFDNLHRREIDPRFEKSIRAYLKGVLASPMPHRGWKLPETTLAYPWIVRLFPSARYVYIVRDPRDCLLKSHSTDDLATFGVPSTGGDDTFVRRVTSWKYQYDIVKSTPTPERFFQVRYEDLVLDYDSVARQLEAFLGIPLARIVVDESRVGLWREDPRVLPHLGPVATAMRELGYDPTDGTDT